MSDSRRRDDASLVEAIPEEWRSFVSSGQFTGARASVRVDGSEVPVELTARVEFLDARRLAIHLALADGPAEDGPARSTGAPVGMLTPRERAVIALIATGRETPEIARTMVVSPATVRTHVRNAMSKLGAHTRAQLVAIVVASEDGQAFADAA